MSLAVLRIFTLFCLGLTNALDKAVIDTDCGGDDAMAIVLMLKYSDYVDLMGVTTVFGNTGLMNVTQNVLKTLQVMDRLDVPVYVGSERALSPDAAQTDNYFGYDGLGDFDYPDLTPVDDYVEQTPAPEYLAEIVKKYPGEINLFAIGPLTNIAKASLLNENFFDQVKSIYILAGTLDGTSSGGFGKGVEFNIAMDPEAALTVFQRAPPSQKIVLFPRGSVKKSSTEWRIYVLGSKWSEEMQFLNQAQRTTFKYSTWGGHIDPALVAAYLDPSTIINQHVGSLAVNATTWQSQVVSGDKAIALSSMNETILEAFYYKSL